MLYKHHTAMEPTETEQTAWRFHEPISSVRSLVLTAPGGGDLYLAFPSSLIPAQVGLVARVIAGPASPTDQRSGSSSSAD